MRVRIRTRGGGGGGEKRFLVTPRLSVTRDENVAYIPYIYIRYWNSVCAALSGENKICDLTTYVEIGLEGQGACGAELTRRLDPPLARVRSFSSNTHKFPSDFALGPGPTLDRN